MAICANQKNYRNAFFKHLHAFEHWQDTGSDISKRLILIYCVECGLKYLVMKQIAVYRTADAREDIQKELGDHDFRKLLGRLHQGQYIFRDISTQHGDYVHPPQYHQMCRYAVRPQNDDMTIVNEYDAHLETIAKWLKERV